MFHNSVQHNVTRGLLEKKEVYNLPVYISMLFKYICVTLSFIITTTLFIVLKSKEKNYKESLRPSSAMYAFWVVIVVIEGPVGLRPL